jgi:hypothetical protein
VEDEAVHTRLERVGETGATVGVRLGVRDRRALAEQLDADARGGASRGGVEHVGRERDAHGRNLRASARWARAISPVGLGERAVPHDRPAADDTRPALRPAKHARDGSSALPFL